MAVKHTLLQSRQLRVGLILELEQLQPELEALRKLADTLELSLDRTQGKPWDLSSGQWRPLTDAVRRAQGRLTWAERRAAAENTFEPVAEETTGRKGDSSTEPVVTNERKVRKMAKELDEKTQGVVDKAVAKALKDERKRVSDSVKGIELPEGTTARAASAIKAAVKGAVAAPAA